jgi:predicted phage baseplate assembly protein
MTLPEVALDDLRFQELVDECRKSITKSCPEWTEVNVSDPGITLIELFAWMTDMLSYRINRLPEKLHVALLELLEVHLRPPEAARGELCFLLERPPTAPVRIPARLTEVATQRTETQEPVVFATRTDFTIRPAQPEVCLFKRGAQRIPITISDGSALPAGAERFVFSAPPLPGDCLLLGFARPLDRLVLRVEVDCKPARGTGVKPKDPPLVWQVSVPPLAQAHAPRAATPAGAQAEESGTAEPTATQADELGTAEPTATQAMESGTAVRPVGPTHDEDGDWSAELELLGDSTDGFNRERGSIELALPARTGAHVVTGHSRPLYWLRCILLAPSPAAPQETYQSPPEIFALSAAPVGATLPAEHCQRVVHELLGRSDGTPGQTFRLRRAPILPTRNAEHLEVRDPDSDRWVHWRRVATFAESKWDDHHYVLDESAGEIELGPAVRGRDGIFKNYGAVPAGRSELRFSAYRHGGGTLGNVTERTLTRLRRPIPGVRSVTNPRAASGGVDGESLALARARTAIELRTRHRAVTREDFESLAYVESGRVARAHCVPAAAGGVARVYIVPRVENPSDRLSLRELNPDGRLLAEVKRRLDECRLVGTSVCLARPRYRGIRVVVQAQASPSSDTVEVQNHIGAALNAYINPLVGGSARGAGTGWEFGRPLRHGELYPIVQGVTGVRRILLLSVYEVSLETGRVTSPAALTDDLKLDEGELFASGLHRVKVDPYST